MAPSVRNRSCRCLRQIDHIALEFAQQPAFRPQAGQLLDQLRALFAVDDDNRRLSGIVDEFEIGCSGAEAETKFVVRL